MIRPTKGSVHPPQCCTGGADRAVHNLAMICRMRVTIKQKKKCCTGTTATDGERTVRACRQAAEDRVNALGPGGCDKMSKSAGSAGCGVRGRGWCCARRFRKSSEARRAALLSGPCIAGHSALCWCRRVSAGVGITAAYCRKQAIEPVLLLAMHRPPGLTPNVRTLSLEHLRSRSPHL